MAEKEGIPETNKNRIARSIKAARVERFVHTNGRQTNKPKAKKKNSLNESANL